MMCKASCGPRGKEEPVPSWTVPSWTVGVRITHWAVPMRGAQGRGQSNRTDGSLEERREPRICLHTSTKALLSERTDVVTYGG